MNSTMQRLSRLTAVLSLVGLLSVGCAAPLKLADDWPQGAAVASSSSGAPAAVVALWAEAAVQQPGGKPLRGLGGRIYFYDARNRPIAVDGQLVVYAYDDSRTEPSAEEADRRYVFTSGELERCFSTTRLGPSYSVFVPWDEAGKAQRSITLLPAFKTADGRVIVGQPSVSVLDGEKQFETQNPSVADGAQDRGSGGLLAGDTDWGANDRSQRATELSMHAGGRSALAPSREGGMRATTIPLPPSTQRRLSAAADISTIQPPTGTPYLATENVSTGFQPPGGTGQPTIGQHSGAMRTPYQPGVPTATQNGVRTAGGYADTTGQAANPSGSAAAPWPDTAATPVQPPTDPPPTRFVLPRPRVRASQDEPQDRYPMR